MPACDKPDDMNILKGKAHRAWCDGCPDKEEPGGKGKCKQNEHCDAMDVVALPFLVEHMDLSLVRRI